ncbi:MAG: hypothetical protein EOP51_27450, partial [Sphingobacteriales bacterium]
MSYWKLRHIKSLSVVVVILLFSAVKAVAQPAGYSAVKDPNALKASLAKTNSEVQTLSSDFTQVKDMALLKEK